MEQWIIDKLNLKRTDDSFDIYIFDQFTMKQSIKTSSNQHGVIHVRNGNMGLSMSIGLFKNLSVESIKDLLKESFNL